MPTRLRMVWMSINYLSYERENLTDVNCFLEKTCISFSYRSTILSSLPLGAEMLSSYTSEIRWIYLDSGLALVHRSWMDGEAESSVDWANMTANFYLGFIYTTETGTDTIAASWAAIQLGDVSLRKISSRTKLSMGSAKMGLI